MYPIILQAMSFWRKDTNERLKEMNLELNLDQDQVEASISRLTFDLPSDPSISSQPERCSSVNLRIDGLNLERNIYYPNLSKEPIPTTDQHPSEVFEDLCVLGQGSCGRVSKMRHKQTNTICAVKQMRFTDREVDNKRVYTDLQILLECNCDYIVRCCGYFITSSELWMCMELMETCCASLMTKRNHVPLPEKFIGAIAVSALKALNYLKEEHNIMHRDVKPSNILINKQGQIKLCDFGISRRLEASIAQTRSGCSCYMAPERIESSGSYDVRADVWSLGITLYELSVGESPYARCQGYLDMLSMILSDPAPSLPDDKEFSDQYRDFIKFCLAKKPESRPKYKQLFQHSFIKMHMDTNVTLDELE